MSVDNNNKFDSVIDSLLSDLEEIQALRHSTSEDDKWSGIVERLNAISAVIPSALGFAESKYDVASDY